MKTIRSLAIVVGLFGAILALGATGAKAQVLRSPDFTGKFTLPYAAQWENMTLPAGEYTLKYGFLDGGADAVEIAGKAKGSPHGTIMAVPNGQSSAVKNSLVCIRDGNHLIVRTLELTAINESLKFGMPHGLRLVSERRQHNERTLAEAPMLIQRLAVIADRR